MPNPQQPELRRSGFVPALDPDATESRLSAEERPSDKGRVGGVPEEQQPGHHPEQEQDKPDLDAFAARLGIVSDGEEPDDAPRKVEAGASATAAATAATPERKREFSPIGLALVGPLTGVKIAKGIVRAVARRKG